MAKSDKPTQRYVVGVIKEDQTFEVRLDGVRKNGEGDGEHLKAERWEVNGFLEADEKGRLILVSKGGELEGGDDDDNDPEKSKK